MTTLADLLRPLPPADPALAAAIDKELSAKTMPPGALGRMTALAKQIGLVQGTVKPRAESAHLLLFAGDHGIVAEGVSAWPQAVTAAMVMNFANGGAAANVFARSVSASLRVIDAGVATPLPEHPAIIRAAVRAGTRNALHEDALTAEEIATALTKGAAFARGAIEEGAAIVALGEMGIGNTASAALLAHAIEGIPLDILAGPGAGLDEPGVAHKLSVLRHAAARRPAPLQPLDALAAFGGCEIAMMAGALLGAAHAGAIVLVDGFIASAAALAALRLVPGAERFCVFAHRSAEPGHTVILKALDAAPLFDLHMRLGEGTGALLAVPLIRAAAALLSEMATFDSAGVPEREP
ncbi:MAG: nicotinate-nucleotide--dimethylbenzimidazole phosphoribosyltransferase [Alphaproteobacteria bacterium]|nr:nicotinate-nucleotide--dimethylbenzimidazole phosphoribosyltransferase [Alphaproteobacteria bacterium]